MTSAPKHLVILLHGIGGSGSTMSPLSLAWRTSMPDTKIVAPDAPFAYEDGAGHQWFGLDGRELGPDRITFVRAAFDGLISDILQKEGFGARLSEVAFVGVSQGAIVALDAVVSGRWHVGALVSFAGYLPPGPISPSARDTKFLLLHGDADTTIPPSATVDAAARLASAGVSVEHRIVSGIGHTISMEEIVMALAFLKARFNR